MLIEAVFSGQVLSLYQGIGTKNLHSFVAKFVYFYGYSYFKKLYLDRSGSKSIGAKANLAIAVVAGACTAIVTQVRTKTLGIAKSFVPKIHYAMVLFIVQHHHGEKNHDLSFWCFIHYA